MPDPPTRLLDYGVNQVADIGDPFRYLDRIAGIDRIGKHRDNDQRVEAIRHHLDWIVQATLPQAPSFSSSWFPPSTIRYRAARPTRRP